MAPSNGARKAPSKSTKPSTKLSLVPSAAWDKPPPTTDRKIKLKVKKTGPKQPDAGKWSDENKVEGGKDKAEFAPTSSIINIVDDKSAAGLPSGSPFIEPPNMVTCKHCKKPILRIAAPMHIRDCLKKKQEKQLKKKEAKEAKEAALRKERNGGISPEPSVDDGADNRARKSAAVVDGVAAKKSGKKRKADEDVKGASAKKKKKEDPKAKEAKAKGPVDVERQCGVQLNNGAQCARSLTCKSHSMGAKRAVPGRSMPYDVLLQQYQKKNQAKQQRAAMDANAPLQDEFEPPGTIDSDEERDAVMTAITRAYHPNPYTGSRLAGAPIFSSPIISAPAMYRYHRMKDILRNALSGTNGHDLFATRTSNLPSTGFFGNSSFDNGGSVHEPFDVSRRASGAPGRQMHPGSRKPSISGQA